CCYRHPVPGKIGSARLNPPELPSSARPCSNLPLTPISSPPIPPDSRCDEAPARDSSREPGCHRVEVSVSPAKRQHTPPAQEVPAEDDAHGHVADERADALVEVIAGAEDRQGDDDRPGPVPEQPQPLGTEAEDEDLFEDSVLRGREDEHRYGPPMVAE